MNTQCEDLLIILLGGGAMFLFLFTASEPRRLPVLWQHSVGFYFLNGDGYEDDNDVILIWWGPNFKKNIHYGNVYVQTFLTACHIF